MDSAARLQTIENEIQIDETGPDFVVRSLEGFLVGAEYCDLIFICSQNHILQAHCAVVSAVSVYIREILRDARDQQDPIHVQLPDVSHKDIQNFLQLVYTGTVSVCEEGRTEFIQLLQLLEACNNIEEYDLPHRGKKRFVRKGGVVSPVAPSSSPPVQHSPQSPSHHNSLDKNNVLQHSSYTTNHHPPPPPLNPLPPASKSRRRKRKRARTEPPPPLVPASAVVIAAANSNGDVLESVGSASGLIEVPVDFCTSEPLAPELISDHPPRKRLNQHLQIKSEESEHLVKAEPPPVEALLAHLKAENDRQECSAAEIVKADLATKAWLQSSSVKVPQMMTNGDGELVLSHIDPLASNPFRKCERCRCPLCMDMNRVITPGEPSMHLCHYPSCGKIYKKTSHLRAHLRWHIGDQPYPCSWPGCSKRFTRSDELHRHFRIHTGERRHKCAVCDKSFSRSDHLKKHMHSHHALDMHSSRQTGSDEIEIDPTELLEVEPYISEDAD